jgi:hypothetical protein
VQFSKLEAFLQLHIRNFLKKCCSSTAYVQVNNCNFFSSPQLQELLIRVCILTLLQLISKAWTKKAIVPSKLGFNISTTLGSTPSERKYLLKEGGSRYKKMISDAGSGFCSGSKLMLK